MIGGCGTIFPVLLNFELCVVLKQVDGSVETARVECVSSQCLGECANARRHIQACGLLTCCFEVRAMPVENRPLFVQFLRSDVIGKCAHDVDECAMPAVIRVRQIQGSQIAAQQRVHFVDGLANVPEQTGGGEG